MHRKNLTNDIHSEKSPQKTQLSLPGQEQTMSLWHRLHDVSLTLTASIQLEGM